MPDKSARSSVHMDVDPNSLSSPTQVADDEPFRILLVGDFSGRSNRGLNSAISGRHPVVIDRDIVDEVFRKFRPSLRMASLELKFETLDDFHPDRVFQRLDIFRKVKQQQSDPPPAIPSNLLESIAEQHSSDAASVVAKPSGDLADFLNKVTAPYLEAAPDAGQQERSARINALWSDLMRGILHQPSFQALEAAWRGIAMLTDRLDTDGALKLYMFDSTLEELVQDEHELEALFANNGSPWGVIAGNFAFGQGDGNITALQLLTHAARMADTPFLAEAFPSVVESGHAWTAFRRSASAPWAGLVLPRFLLRLPYGARTSPIESFPFEEMPQHEHARYLWGNPALCCALLLGLTFLDEGWNMRPGAITRLEGMPVHTYEEDGQIQAKPVAEVFMSENDADLLLENGLMPLASIKNSDSVLLVRFQSVALPLAPLAGRWRGQQR